MTYFFKGGKRSTNYHLFFSIILGFNKSLIIIVNDLNF